MNVTILVLILISDSANNSFNMFETDLNYYYFF